MARFNPAAYLQRLVDLAINAGVTIYENTLVTGPTEKHTDALDAGKGKVSFDQVICATHCNFAAAKLLYAATPPYQSYLVRVRTWAVSSIGTKPNRHGIARYTVVALPPTASEFTDHQNRT